MQKGVRVVCACANEELHSTERRIGSNHFTAKGGWKLTACTVLSLSWLCCWNGCGARARVRERARTYVHGASARASSTLRLEPSRSCLAFSFFMTCRFEGPSPLKTSVRNTEGNYLGNFSLLCWQYVCAE